MVKSMEVLKPVMMISSWRRIDASSLGAPPCRAAHSLNLAPDVAPCQLMLLLLTPSHSSLVATVCRRGCTIPMMVSRDSPVDFQSHSSNDFHHHVVCNTEQHLALRLRTSTVSIPSNSGTGRIGGNCRHSS